MINKYNDEKIENTIKIYVKINSNKSIENELKNYIAQFDLSDKKILWDGDVNCEFSLECIIIDLKKTNTYPEFKLEYLGINETIKFEYISGPKPAEYLFDEQKSNGTFKYRSTYIGGAASTNELAMNAYIIWALSEVCPDDQRLEKSVNYLKKEMEDTDDSYTLALMANVFANTNNKSEANDVIKQLKSRVVVENNGSYLTSGINDYYGTRGRYQTIQTTALASLALTKLNSNQDTNEEFVKYIYSAKDYRGTWGTTQATVLALKAITEFSEGSDIKEQTVVVSINGEEQKIDIGKNSLDVYELDFENLSVENHFSIELEKGKMSYEIVKNYYEKYDNVKENDKFEITQTIDTVAKVNDIITQSIEIVNRTVNIENGLLEVNIPQGCTPIEESLLELKYDGKIEKYEYNYGKIYIYLRTFNQL